MKVFHIIATLLLTLADAIEINVDDESSIKAATSTVAKKLRALYPDDQPWFVAGEFGKLRGREDEGYYWWEGGAVMGAWIEYWSITGDDQYNDLVTEAMLAQTGDNNDYEPESQTLALGNDDQAFWAIAALTAAERGFPDPPKDKPQWLALAQAVFNRQVGRWDEVDCKGGLLWQVFAGNKGYDYKNSVSNGLLVQMGARLARYTGNQTYADWAEKAYRWSKDLGLITHDYHVVDGAHVPDCKISSPYQWTYNAGIYLAGTAFLYDYYTGIGKADNAGFWQDETQKLLNATDLIFFNRNDGHPNVMRESSCELRPPYEGTPTCNVDQRSFKGYLARFMAYTWQLCPFTRDYIMVRLRASALSAAKSCTGNPDGNTCGLSWIMEKYDGSPYGVVEGGVGEHLAVMELFQNLLIKNVALPLTHLTGTSKGDVGAGTGGSGLSAEDLLQTGPTTTGDRVGAGILTTMFIIAPLGLSYWMVFK